MIDIAATFTNIALGISEAFGGPYFAGAVLSHTAPVYDDGGSILTPGAPQERPCMVQIDRASWEMRQADGFVDGTMLCLVLANTLTGDLDTDARLRVDGGPNAGLWLVSGIAKDAAGIYWQGTGRRA